MNSLAIEPLTRAAFAPFGEVLEMAGASPRMINEGTTERYHALAQVDVGSESGKAIVSLFRASRRPLPILIGMLERHPLGSQAFYPLQPDDWLVVVGEGKARPEPGRIRCFRATGGQGVNYARNVWHHPVLILAPRQDFIVVDREGPGNNLEECWFEPADRLAITV